MNLKKIIRSGESETVEFKESFNDAVIETLSAFANAHGVTVFKTSHKTRVETRVEPRVKTGVKTSEAILTLIRENPSITRKELATHLQLTMKGIDWNLTKLKKEGRLKRIGPDKGGYWVVE